MAINSSYHKIAEQVINYNNTVVELLSNITTLVSGQENTITLMITDQSGIAQEFTLPSFGYLKKEIDRLNNNINSIYSINDSGALIQPTDGTKFRKIVTVDLNREPNDLNNLTPITQFSSSKNWFFDGLLNPSLYVELDLSGKIENNVRKILCRRYIPEFEKTIDGEFTTGALAAINSFNTKFNNQTGFTLDEYLIWHTNTPGLVNPEDPNYDEQMFDLEPNYLETDGYFSILRVEEDTLNRKLFYYVNTLSYAKKTKVSDTILTESRELIVGDELIINTPVTSTRYRIIEISTVDASPKLRFERVEGLEPIPVGINTMKVYSPVIYNKRVKISVGYDERNLVFIKALNMDNYILSKNWSTGVGFYTRNLTDVASGVTMDEFYTEQVYDYGLVLEEMVAKKLPNKFSSPPLPPTLVSDNFKVVQINQHLTNTPDTDTLKRLHSQTISIKSEVTNLEENIRQKNQQLRSANFESESQRRQANSELDELVRTKESQTKLLSSTNNRIIAISNGPVTKVEPKFRLRGFWDFPELQNVRGSKPQEVVQFRVQYRYLAKDGTETPVESFKITNVDNQTKIAAFANWNEFKTDARKRVQDKSTGDYYWEIQDVSNAETPNINQLDLAIQANERLEIRIASISEVGWPESALESEFSQTLTIDFPDNLNNVVNENDFILKAADKESLKISLDSELSAKGIDEHLSDTTELNGQVYYHSSDRILSLFKDANGNGLDLFSYLQTLESRLKVLEEKVAMAKGVLQVILVGPSSELIINSGSTTNINIELEDYLEEYTATNVPTGRVYKNQIYVIKDYIVRIKNNSADSPIGLLSNRNYNSSTNAEVYNGSSPQVFFVDQQNQLLTSDTSGVSRTQLDNQFVWSVNYDNIDQTSVVKLAQNIANNFEDDNTNSLISTLSSETFNLGYQENEILTFVGNNKSLFDASKWIESGAPTVASTVKLLTTIHPELYRLDNIQETNSSKLRTINPGSQNDVALPINVYFKMNSLDPSLTGNEFVNLNGNSVFATHVKKVKFLMENESENKPFVFTLQFTLKRAKTILSQTSGPIARPAVVTNTA